MIVDPRHRNRFFNPSSIERHVNDYVDALSAAMRALDWSALERAVEAIESARVSHSRIWTAGNGGSAAIADHLLCDWLKGTFVDGHDAIHVHSLTADTALLTACANDFGYDIAFSRQLEMRAQKGDLLVCITSSGNSANILAAMNAAKALGMTTIAFTGFDGGEARRIADINLHVAASNYGVVEDGHQILMHNIAQYVFSRQAQGL